MGRAMWAGVLVWCWRQESSLGAGGAPPPHIGRVSYLTANTYFGYVESTFMQFCRQC